MVKKTEKTMVKVLEKNSKLFLKTLRRRSCFKVKVWNCVIFYYFFVKPFKINSSRKKKKKHTLESILPLPPWLTPAAETNESRTASPPRWDCTFESWSQSVFKQTQLFISWTDVCHRSQMSINLRGTNSHAQSYIAPFYDFRFAATAA